MAKRELELSPRCISMRAIVQEGKKLSLSEKFSRLAVRLRDPDWRRYGKLLFAGKMMGVALVLLIMFIVAVIPHLPALMESTAHAAEAEVKAADAVYPTVKAADI